MTTKQIELREVTLRKQDNYERHNPGRWVAKVEYRTENSETSLVLGPEASSELLAFLGPLIVKHASAAAVAVAEDMQRCIDASEHGQLEEGKATRHVNIEHLIEPEDLKD